MKTFKTFALAIALILGFASANAQILYKVEKPGSDKVSYLLGTHHFAPLAVVDSITELPGILAGIDRLYGELDMQQMNDPAVMTGMQQVLVAPADSTLDKALDPQQLQTLESAWNTLTGGAAPLQMMYPMKPAVVSTQIAAILTQKVFPELNPLEGIDMTMQTRARELGKPVGGLETMEFQMDMLYGRPVAEQAEELMKTVSDLEKVEKESVELSKAYLAHDIDSILRIMEEGDDDPAMTERMIFSRNDNWVKILSKEMPQESLMVVVGAGHLPGKRGVIEGLRSAGFTVTPVK